MKKVKLLPEWYPQDAIMLTWPHHKSDWASNLEAVEQEFLQFASTIANYENVVVVCYDEQQKNALQSKLRLCTDHFDKFIFVITASNDSWARDHGPITVIDNNENLHLLDFQFNGWGKKYQHSLDNQINQCLYQQRVFKNLQSIDFILEGGSIEINSKQELLTTTRCLLSKNRNNFTKDELNHKLETLLGAKKIHWLNHGYLIGDDTDAHIDTLARFVSDDIIAYVKCDDKNDEHYSELCLMEQELQKLTNIAKQPYQLLPLPWPKPQFCEQGKRLPLTYANFLMINNAILVPNFGDIADNIAEDQLKSIFPNKEIIGIPSQQIIQQFGSLHCLSMQLPRGSLHESQL